MVQLGVSTNFSKIFTIIINTSGNYLQLPLYTLSFVLLIYMRQFWVISSRQTTVIKKKNPVISQIGMTDIETGIFNSLNKRISKLQIINYACIPFWSNIDNQENLSLKLAKRNILPIDILHQQPPCISTIYYFTRSSRNSIVLNFFEDISSPHGREIEQPMNLIIVSPS